MDGSEGLAHPSQAAVYDGAFGRPSDPSLPSPRLRGADGAASARYAEPSAPPPPRMFRTPRPSPLLLHPRT